MVFNLLKWIPTVAPGLAKGMGMSMLRPGQAQHTGVPSRTLPVNNGTNGHGRAKFANEVVENRAKKGGIKAQSLPAIVIASFFFLPSLWSCAPAPVSTSWPEITTESKPHTRWWWLGSDVDSAGLTYNLEAMSRAGIGGVEITPIYGVKGREKHYRDFLSPGWMRMLAFTQTEAKRLGMNVDMNTGTGWPFGGPEVSLEDAAGKAVFDRFSLKKDELIVEKFDAQGDKNARLDKVMIYLASGRVIDATGQVGERGLFSYTPPEDGQMVALYVGRTLQKVKRAAPGGQGYVLNHFDKGAVKRYLSKFDTAFQAADAPYPKNFFNDSYEVYGADWTPDLLQEFYQRRGYRLEEHFSELLDNGRTETSVRVISDYRETLGEILKDNFTAVWTGWAHGHGASTKNQAHGSPANLIDLYAAVDIPECETFGISDFDIPGLRKDSIRKKNDGDPTILKYASSAANITGKPLTSAETFTWLTEHFRTSLSQCKPEIDQMFTAGVNHVYFHGNTYSPREAAWPGWKFYASVDMSPTNSIWKDAPAFFTYISRVQAFLQNTKPDNDFLLYFPVYDIWAGQRGSFFTTFAIHGMRERLPEFCDLAEKIMQSGFDPDYISDTYIRTTTVQNNGHLQTQGGSSYKAIIVPAAKIIPLETLNHLLKLAEEGATVIFTDHYPHDVPGLKDQAERQAALKALLSRLPHDTSFTTVQTHSFGKGKIITGSQDFLKEFSEGKEPFRTDLGGQLIRKKHNEGHLYFMTMLQNVTVDGWVPLSVTAASVLIFDPTTGKTGRAAIRKNNGQTEVYLQLKPGQSLILKTFSDAKVKADNWPYYTASGNKTELKNGWELSFPESTPEVKEHFKPNTPGSWTDLNHEELKINTGTGKYTIRFNLQKKEGREYQLNLGDVRESARVRINGRDAGTLFAVPFEMNIGQFLKNGENTLEVEVTNLPANRIRDYDRRGVNWRIFHEINFVSITYKNTKFDEWEIMPSGLLGPVVIREMERKDPK